MNAKNWATVGFLGVILCIDFFAILYNGYKKFRPEKHKRQKENKESLMKGVKSKYNL
jgi:hypothetical protein